MGVSLVQITTVILNAPWDEALLCEPLEVIMQIKSCKSWKLKAQFSCVGNILSNYTRRLQKAPNSVLFFGRIYKLNRVTV